MSSEEDHRLSCEAKFWLSIVRKHGRQRWNEHKARMIKKRGVESVKKLTDEMSRINRNNQ